MDERKALGEIKGIVDRAGIGNDEECWCRKSGDFRKAIDVSFVPGGFLSLVMMESKITVNFDILKKLDNGDLEAVEYASFDVDIECCPFCGRKFEW